MLGERSRWIWRRDCVIGGVAECGEVLTGGREAQSFLAAARTAANRQSPPEIGRWEYQRDRHRDGLRWEQAWIDQLAVTSERQALLATSGMAAISTVLAHLERSLCADGPVLVDVDVYHETRHLLATGAIARRCVVVQSDLLVDAIVSLNPAAVVVDAVSNRPDVRVADLGAIRNAVASASPRAVTVLDASVCSMMDPWISEHIDLFETPLIVVESLTKHAQLGLDRIPGGLIVSDPAIADAIDRLREHLGSNITDLACAALPDPSRRLMEFRLVRQASNASILAKHLHDAGLDVSHPSLPDHPDNVGVRVGRGPALGPRCGIIGLRCSNARRFVERALAAAARREQSLENGVGFGFDVTRIYETTQSIPEASAFVRIAAGIEPIDEVHTLGAALVEAIQ